MDNVLYSCDFSEKKSHDIDTFKSKPDSEVIANCKTVIKKGMKRKQEKHSSELNEQVVEKRNKAKGSPTSGTGITPQVTPRVTSPHVTSPPQETTNAQGKTVERVSVDVQSPLPRAMDPLSGKCVKECNCTSSASSIIGGNGAGWEGTALINHGSHIKIGCLQFVFSITNFGTSGNQSLPTGHSQGHQAIGSGSASGSGSGNGSGSGSGSGSGRFKSLPTDSNLLNVSNIGLSSSRMSISSNSSTVSAASTPSRTDGQVNKRDSPV